MNPKEIFKLKKMQSQMQKQLEQIYAAEESGDFKVVVRGDRRIESIEIDGEPNKELKDIINKALKEVNKKVEKQMRGQLSDFGFPGL